ncbi:MAG: PspC domain-containing protein [Saprospiraceae bacterium]|jgi:phage shock protein PspC (stress-responsive transcriptional regulator)|nr:PspC domain-containing protein [Saprospiraceae bacterium]
MNKVFNINLGGYPFTIDEDAFDHLTRYLEAIKKHFRHTEGREEILNDIETRMAELLQERLTSRQIVSNKDVREVISVMGTPEEFGAEPMQEPAAGGERGKYKTGKRLFRNTDDEVIGGVCSGIAAYFGIQDAVWVRLFFVIFTLSGGFGVPLYIVLWIILPKAESASDRLSMRGEPINFTTIGNIIQQEFQKFSKEMSKLGDELGAGEEGAKKKVSRQRRGLIPVKRSAEDFLL